jgi:hypothetical protein
VLPSDETKLADELPRRVHDDELLGFIISNNLDLPIDEHEEVRIRLAGTVEHVSCCQFASFAELEQLFQDVRQEGRETADPKGRPRRSVIC